MYLAVIMCERERESSRPPGQGALTSIDSLRKLVVRAAGATADRSMAGEWWNVEGAKASAEEARSTAAAAACADMVLKKKERKRGREESETRDERERGRDERGPHSGGWRKWRCDGDEVEGDDKVLSFQVRGRSCRPLQWHF